MAVALALGEWRDALFGFVMVLNLAIGVVQEWRAKTTLDRLTLITAPKVAVWRDGTRREVASDEVVIERCSSSLQVIRSWSTGSCCTPMGSRWTVAAHRRIGAGATRWSVRRSSRAAS